MPSWHPCNMLLWRLFWVPPDVQRFCQLPGPQLIALALLCRRDLFTSMLPKWEALLTTDLRMLVFSGDVDGIVPVRLPCGLKFRLIRALASGYRSAHVVWVRNLGSACRRVPASPL